MAGPGMTDGGSETDGSVGRSTASVRGTPVRAIGSVALVLLIGLVGLTLVLVLRPVGVADPLGTRAPAATYEDAMAKLAAVEERESDGLALLDECRSRVLGPAARADRVIVLVHGYSTCPQQYHVMADMLVERGYTVYLPRMPQHGEVERVRTTLDRLTAEELVDFANETVDIATGLGDHVTVLGLSGGGAVAAYIGQFRDDVDDVVTIAPFLGIPAVPPDLTPALVNALQLLPPLGIGDTPNSQAVIDAYAPYSSYDNNTHAAAAFMTLGQVVLADAATRAPVADKLTVVVNDADDIVNNALIDRLFQRWDALAPEKTSRYDFDAALALPHDIIGPDRKNEVVEQSYPALFELLGTP